MPADNIDSIKGVQEAEQQARLILEEAKKRRDAKLADSEMAARKIIEEAEIKAAKDGEATLKKAEMEISELRKMRLAEVLKKADSIKKTKLGRRGVEKLAERVARNIAE